MILRELVAVFGVQFRGDGVRKAERGLRSLQDRVELVQGAFARLLGAAALAAPFVGLIRLASSAEEQLNQLEVAFGSNASTVEKWASETGAALGRSKFSLVELAGSLGLMTTALTESQEESAKMSTSLAELALDIGSVKDTDPREVVRALASGLSGETEAIKRFGIVMTEANLQQFALAEGLAKSTKNMTSAEKTQLRYNFIMSKGELFAGDLAKTQGSVANQTRRALDSFRDIGTELGLFLLPGIRSLLGTGNQFLEQVQKYVERFRKWAEHTTAARVALMLIGGLILALVIPAIKAMFIALVPLLPTILAFTAFAVVIDDVINAFTGGESVFRGFGEWLDDLEAKQVPGALKALDYLVIAINRIRDAIGALIGFGAAAIEAVATGSITPLVHAFEALKDTFKTGTVNFAKKVAGDPLSKVRSSNIARGRIRVGEAKEFFARGAQGTAGFTSPYVQRGHQELVPVTLNQGGQTITFNLQAMPGEASEDFAKRVASIINQEQAKRDQEIVNNLTQTAKASP